MLLLRLSLARMFSWPPLGVLGGAASYCVNIAPSSWLRNSPTTEFRIACSRETCSAVAPACTAYIKSASITPSTSPLESPTAG